MIYQKWWGGELWTPARLLSNRFHIVFVLQHVVWQWCHTILCHWYLCPKTPTRRQCVEPMNNGGSDSDSQRWWVRGRERRSNVRRDGDRVVSVSKNINQVSMQGTQWWCQEWEVVSYGWGRLKVRKDGDRVVSVSKNINQTSIRGILCIGGWWCQGGGDGDSGGWVTDRGREIVRKG